MKKICRKIKLRKFKSMIEELGTHVDSLDYIVCYDDSTYFHALNKEEVRECLEKDHIKGIRYIFDMTDRICIYRDVIIDTDNI